MKKGLKQNKYGQAVAGVDSLYFFVQIDISNYITNYPEYLSGEAQIGQFLGHSGKDSGFIGAWYSLEDSEDKTKVARIGFKDPTKQKQVHNVFVQLEASAIYKHGLLDTVNRVQELIHNQVGAVQEIYVSRADLNTFVQKDLSHLRKEMFVTRATSSTTHSKEFIKGYNLETLYIGSSKSPLHLKIYNKTEELQRHITARPDKFIHTLNYLRSAGLDTSLPIWNIEFTLKREVLMQYGVNTFSDLMQNLNGIWRDLMERYKYVGKDVERIEKYKANKNQSKLKTDPFWKEIIESYDVGFDDQDVVRTPKLKYTPTKITISETLKQQFTRANKYECDFTISEILELMNQAKSEAREFTLDSYIAPYIVYSA